MKEKILLWLVFHMPKTLVYWATIRMFSVASEYFHDKEAGTITFFDGVEAWKARDE